MGKRKIGFADCPQCNGTGFCMPEGACPNCNGLGFGVTGTNKPVQLKTKYDEDGNEYD